MAYSTWTSGDFLATPASVNSTKGSIARFTCSISNNDFIFWLVNGTEARFLKGRQICEHSHGNNTVKVSTLTILSSEENNNSMVECVQGIGEEEIITERVTLTVQGQKVDTIITG